MGSIARQIMRNQIRNSAKAMGLRHPSKQIHNFYENRRVKRGFKKDANGKSN